MKNTTGLYKHQRDNCGARRKLPSAEKPYRLVPVLVYEYEKARAMKIEDRPTEMLERQLQANRNAALYRNPETGKRHHAHIDRYRPHFVREILAMRSELRNRSSTTGHDR